MSASAMSKLHYAEQQVRNARTHFERGVDVWGEAFLRDAERLIAEARALSEPSGGGA